MLAGPSVNVGWKKCITMGTERKGMGTVMLKYAAEERNRVFGLNFMFGGLDYFGGLIMLFM